MFLLLLFLLIIVWVTGYSPLLFNGIKLFSIAGIPVGLHEFIVISLTLLISFTLPKPFRQVTLLLILFWLFSYLGIPLSTGIYGTTFVGGITMLFKQGKLSTESRAKRSGEILKIN